MVLVRVIPIKISNGFNNLIYYSMVDHVKVSGQMFVQRTQGTLRDIYKIGHVLGEGAFGEVRLCTHRETKEKRAVKVLKKDDMKKRGLDSPDRADALAMTFAGPSEVSAFYDAANDDETEVIEVGRSGTTGY